MLTKCAGCCFQEGSPQTGCLANQIGTYKYEINNGSFEFAEKLCQFWRGADWALTKELAHPGLSLYEIARAEVTINTCLVINGGSLKEIEKTLNSISGLPPSRIITLNPLDNTTELDELLNKQAGRWTVSIYMDDGDYRPWIMTNCNDNMYCFVNGGFEFCKDFFGKIDRYVNDELGRFLVIEGEGILYVSKNYYLMNQIPFEDLIVKTKENKEGYVEYEYFSS